MLYFGSRMSMKSQNSRIIFGLKVKQLRLMNESNTFEKLSKHTGMSVSYLNEIEKGKKYPKADKVGFLAEALDVSVEELTSLELTGNLAPLGELLKSNFLSELPLDMFGIELSKVVSIIASAPLRVGAFISTLVELARNYAMREENFYHGAMRAYQEMHYNYFEDIEDKVMEFVAAHEVPIHHSIKGTSLAVILKKTYKYKIDESGLADFPDLQRFRSIYLPREKKLLLNREMTDRQKTFQYSKELAFNFLDLKSRMNTSSLINPKSFEQVLHHFKANYFATALLIPKDSFIKDLEAFFKKKRWNGDSFLGLMRKYDASPEMLFARMTNVIPRVFGLKKIFFIRAVHDHEKDSYQIDKELHLDQVHHAHSNRLYEHYCRRWMSISLLKDLSEIQAQGKYVDTMVGAQRSKYFGTKDEYLCLTLARTGKPTPDINFSVTIGILVDDELQKTISFWDDPSITIRQVNKTCERCPIDDCEERAHAATIIETRAQRKKVQDALKKIME